MLRVLPGLLVLAVWLYALIDCILTPESEQRKLPKPLWVLVVVLIPLIGSICWLILGRPAHRLRPGGPAGRSGRGPGQGRSPQWSPPRPLGPDDDPDFLRQLRRRGSDRPGGDKPPQDRGQPTPDGGPDRTDAGRADAGLADGGLADGGRAETDRTEADRAGDGSENPDRTAGTDPDNPDGAP